MIGRTFLTVAFGVLIASTSHAQVKLEYKFKEGRQTAVKTTSKVKQTLTLAGMDIETAAEEVASVHATVGKRGGDGLLPIQRTTDAIRLQFEIAGMMFAYDTADPNAKIENAQLAVIGNVLKALAGTTITIVLDNDNKLKAVEGTEKIKEAAKALDPQAAELLESRLGFDRIKQQFDKAQGNLPAILVREGEPWEHTEVDDIGSGQTLTFRRRYEYKGTVDRNGKMLDRISITALDVKYEMDPNAKSPLKAVKSDLKIDSSKGEMLFDREEGMVIERKEVNRIKGDIDFKAGDNDVPAKLDLTLDVASETTKAAK